jgi:hypothetical protein
MPEEEQHIEVVGAGFVPGIPGIFGNQRITKAGEVVALPVIAPVADEEPTPDAAPAQPAPQSSSTSSRKSS